MRTTLFISFLTCLVSVPLQDAFACSARKIYVQADSQFESLFTVPNATYIIRGEVNLKGKTLHIPDGCTLCFKKGSLVNGSLIGSNTKLKSLSHRCIGVNLAGSWNCETIRDTYYDTNYLSDNQIIVNINNQQSNDYFQEIVLEKPHYSCAIPKNDGALLVLKSNTSLTLNTSISIEGNSYTSYNIIRIMGRENVTVKGGELHGDVGRHSYSLVNSSQWGHGINIHSSKNVKVSDIIITHCIGDGVAISGGKEQAIGDYSYASTNIRLNNVTARFNRRQGLSIIHASDVEISNCVFSDTGVIEKHSPSAGIDIEPNTAAPYFQAVRNVSITKCTLERNVGYGILSNHYESNNGISSVENVLFSDCRTDSQVVLYTGGINFRNTSMKQLSIIAEKDPITGSKFFGCVIAGGYGVQFYCPNSGFDVSTKIGDLVFENCDISVPSKGNLRTSNGIFWCRGKSERMRNVTIRNSRVTIPQEVTSQFNLFGTANTDIYFENSRILIPGRNFPEGFVNRKNCKIVSRNINE